MGNFKEIHRVPFETRIITHPNGTIERKIFVDNVMMDYSVDITSLHEAMKMGPAYAAAIKADIVRHFASCVSEMVNRKVTYDEIIEAAKNGYI